MNTLLKNTFWKIRTKQLGFLLVVTVLIGFAFNDQYVSAQTTPSLDRSSGEPSERIHIGAFDFDPLVDGEPTVSRAGSPLNQDGYGLFLVQTTRSLTRAEQSTLADDLALIQHIPYEAYIVWGRRSGLSRAANSIEAVRWVGDWHPAYRVLPLLEVEDGSKRVRVQALLVNDGQLQDVARRIASLGGERLAQDPYQRVNRDLMVESWEFRLARNQMDALADVPQLISLGELGEPAATDELSNQILSRQLEPGTVGYDHWLNQTGYDGSGVKVAIVDTGVDWDHPDLNVVSGTHYSPHYNESGEPGSDNGGHGTHVAGIVAGTAATGVRGGLGFLLGLGVAPGSTLHAQDYLFDCPTPGTCNYPSSQTLAKDSYDSGAPISQNSWATSGNPWLGSYYGDAPSYDQYTLDVDPLSAEMESLLYVFAAGNDGRNTVVNGSIINCPSGTPCTPSIKTPAVAKNVIAVGSTNSLRPAGDHGVSTQPDDVTDFSSRGPAQDGRIKPDVVAPGANIISTRDSSGSTQCANVPVSAQYTYCSGTSMAAPHVAGVAALFTQMWRERVNDPTHRPDPALIKAAIIATTDDIRGGDDGFGNTVTARPNKDQGWGLVNIDRLLNPPVPIVYYENPQLMTTTGQDWTITVTPADLAEPLRITLVWSDEQGALNANPARVNDLDLTVTDPIGTVWTANHFDNLGWSDTNVSPNHDRINNVENIWIGTPRPGEFTINVDAFALRGNAWRPNDGDAAFDQHFSVVCYNCIEKQYVDASNDSGLEGYWKFDAATGSLAFDMTENRRVAVLAANAQWDTDSFISNNFGAIPNYASLRLDSGDDYAYAADPITATSVDDMTISAVIQLDDYSGATAQNLVWKGVGNGYTLYIQNGHPCFYLDLLVDETPGEFLGQCATNVTLTNGWVYHLTLTYSKDGYLRLYKGDQIVLELKVDYPIRNDPTKNLFFGFATVGNIDDVRVYSRALQAVEIGRLVDRYPCETDGASWHTAHRNLDCALSVAAVGNIYFREIDVAQGTYKPGTSRNASFTLWGQPFRANTLQIRGGFAGNGSDTRNPQAFPTILSGDLDGNDANGAPQGLNSYHVVETNAGLAFLEGFTVENGLANGSASGPYPDNRGAGIFDSSGGVYTQVTLRNNVASTFGGGLAAHESSPNIYRSRFIGNRAEYGGAISLNGSKSLIQGSLFSGNVANNFGGAVNITGNDGIAPSFNNNSFTYNIATAFPDSGVAWVENTDLTIENSILWRNNTAGTEQIRQVLAGTTTVNDSIVEGGWSGSGSGNLSDDPLFIDPDGVDNVYGTSDDDLHIPRTSPAVDSGGVNCTPGKFISTPYIDGDGDDVAECDRGAYEFGTLLVVDDDDNIPDLASDMIEGLRAGGQQFEWWDVGGGVSNEPTSDRLAAHNRIFWFTGDHTNSSGTVGPQAAATTALEQWLDAGHRCLLLSSMEYRYSQGPTSFATNYLGVQSVTQDQGYTQVTGQNLFDTLSFTLGKGRMNSQWSDVIVPQVITQTLFTSDKGSTGIVKTTAFYRAAYLGFSPAMISADSATARADRGQLFATYFDENCQPPFPFEVVPTAVTLESQVTGNRSRSPLVMILVMLTLVSVTVKGRGARKV